MTSTIIIIAVVLLIAFYSFSIFNKLVKKRTMMEEGYSGIDVQLKKRYNLIPNLIETVKGYATHEQDTLEKVVSARNMAMSAGGTADQVQAENQLNSALMNLFALGEAYPDLKANTSFVNLQNQLSEIEEDIDKARRYYNATVRENNIMVESFPSNLVAKSFSFFEGEYFELENKAERAAPQVKF